jgi:hypothetical protein
MGGRAHGLQLGIAALFNPKEVPIRLKDACANPTPNQAAGHANLFNRDHKRRGAMRALGTELHGLL